mgnify:FL=1
MKNYLLILLMMFPLLSHSAISRKPSNNVLKIGMTQEFENMNPIIKQMMATSYIYEMVGRTLVVLDEKGKWIPQLVKKYPTLENGLAKMYTEKGVKKIKVQWEMKDLASWGDGTPVTGYDVEFSHKIALSKNISVGETEVYAQVEKIIVDKKNPKKFTFINEKAKWSFNQLATFQIVPKHLESAVFDKFGKDKEGYSKNSIYSVNPTHPGLYNGPYKIQEIKLGSHVTLVPNPTFYGKAPKIQKIILKLIPNTGTLEANLRSGNIDMISILGLTLDQAISLDKKLKKEKSSHRVNFKQGLIYEHIDLQLSNPILKDINVRKALVHSINRQKLTQALFEGKQTPALHNVAPIDTWFTKDPKKVVVYKYSRRKAKKLLDKAGWKMGKDGYRHKDGKKLGFQLMTTSGNKLRELVEVYLQEEWKKIGVEISIKNEPPRVYFGETVKKSKFPAMAMFAWISSPENTPRSTFHSKSIPTDKNGYSGQNAPRWKNKSVDKLIDEIDVTFDSDKRKELVHKVLYHYTNEVPVIPLYYRSDISVTPKNLVGYKLTGHQFSSGNHVEGWELK